MSQVKTKPPPVESLDKSQDEVRRFVSGLSLSPSLAMLLKKSNVLTELQAPERHKAMTVIRRRCELGNLGYSWLASFLGVLEVLKNE